MPEEARPRRSLDRSSLNILLASEVIAMNQDPLGVAGDLVWKQGPIEVCAWHCRRSTTAQTQPFHCCAPCHWGPGVFSYILSLLMRLVAEQCRALDAQHTGLQTCCRHHHGLWAT